MQIPNYQGNSNGFAPLIHPLLGQEDDTTATNLRAAQTWVQGLAPNTPANGQVYTAYTDSSGNQRGQWANAPASSPPSRTYLIGASFTGPTIVGAVATYQEAFSAIVSSSGTAGFTPLSLSGGTITLAGGSNYVITVAWYPEVGLTGNSQQASLYLTAQDAGSLGAAWSTGLYLPIASGTSTVNWTGTQSVTFWTAPASFGGTGTWNITDTIGTSPTAQSPALSSNYVINVQAAA